nr:GNAT family N-acetyltransferase [Polymorphobacter sp.]
MDAAYDLMEAVPTVAEHGRLRVIAGMSAKAPEAAALGLPNSWYGVVVRHGGVAVGMGRVVGDGGLFFQVVDIAVDPAHQGRGLGKAIMAAIVAKLRRDAPASAYVSLIADGEAYRLYAQYGFALTAPDSVGMAMTMS